MIRGVSTDDLKGSRVWSVIGREALAGILLGAVLGIVVTVWAYFIQGDWLVAMAVGGSLLAIALLAAVAGSSLPFLFKTMKFDPALMSAPIITTAVDVLGVAIYLSFARWLLNI